MIAETVILYHTLVTLETVTVKCTLTLKPQTPLVAPHEDVK